MSRRSTPNVVPASVCSRDLANITDLLRVPGLPRVVCQLSPSGRISLVRWGANAALGALSLLLAVGCVVDLSVGDGVRVACTADTECPGGRRCGARGWCIAADEEEDVAPPQLVAVEAADPETVVVTFNEPIAQHTLLAVESYEIVPALEVAGVLPDEQSVTVLTTTQTLGTSYTLTIRGVADVVGNVVSDPGLIGAF